MKSSAARQTLAVSALLLLSSAAVTAGAQSNVPKAEKGYRISIFAKGVIGKYTAPDSIAILNNRVFIAYGDGNDPAGRDGKANKIVEYDFEGRVIFSYNVIGHNDGLKINPYTHQIWAMQNEDANPNLVIIDTKTRQQSVYVFNAPPPNGGGYDDIVFRKGDAYFSASNPAKNPNAGPAIVKAKFVGNTINVVPVLEGNATATDVVTGNVVTLNLQDPDSMTLTPTGDLLLDSQGDSELIMVRKPGTRNQSALQIPLSSPLGTPQVDDTLFVPSEDGFILVTDTPSNTTYKIEKTEFIPGTAYSAGQGATAGGGTPGFVGRLDLDFGVLIPVVTGLNSPHGLAFVKLGGDDDDDGPCWAR